MTRYFALLAFFALFVSLRVPAVAQDLQIAGKIAFNSDRDGNREIYVMNADGTGQTRLTNNSADDYGPSWSPDGTKITFQSNRDGNYEIYVMNADGTNLICLTNNSAQDREPSWSPDGTKIVFHSDRTGNGEIFVMNADGTGQTNLTNHSADDTFSSWSPDGTKIAFASNRVPSGPTPHGVWVMNADGTNPVQLTSGTSNAPMGWSPDGVKLVFTAHTATGSDEVFVMNANGTGQTNLTNHSAPDGARSWLPDGTRIVFGTKRDGNDEIYVMNKDGSGLVRLTNNSASDTNPDWTPFRRIGSASIGTPISRTMTIQNTGSATLNVSNITSSDGQFTISPTSFNVSPGTSQDVTVTFNPTSAGTKYATLTITSNDPDNPTVKLIVNGKGNQPPVVGAITAPVDPVAVNTTINAIASFTDPDVFDTHTAVWAWGDGSTSSGVVTETNGSGSVSGSHTYTAAGVYTVALTVTDNGGASDTSIFQFIVVFDPSAGFVTGGGWIDSPAGAYAPNPSLTGRANFGFVSKFQKGANVPTGQTQFNFRVTSLDFHSTSYEWLVVAGAKAQYKGSGTINKGGDYGFMLSAIDGQISGGGGVDKFRIKIWDKVTGGVVYDNQMGASDDTDPTTAIGGGSIVIHKDGAAKPVVLGKSDDGLLDGTLTPEALPEVFGVDQNYPNPFNPATTIRYALPEASDVRLTIYNVLGQQVRVLVQGRQEAGYYRVTWDGKDDYGRAVSSGIYLYRFVSKGLVQTQKMLLLK